MAPQTVGSTVYDRGSMTLIFVILREYRVSFGEQGRILAGVAVETTASVRVLRREDGFEGGTGRLLLLRAPAVTWFVSGAPDDIYSH